jgi:hypothetical protein
MLLRIPVQIFLVVNSSVFITFLASSIIFYLALEDIRNSWRHKRPASGFWKQEQENEEILW